MRLLFACLNITWVCRRQLGLFVNFIAQAAQPPVINECTCDNDLALPSVRAVTLRHCV